MGVMSIKKYKIIKDESGNKMQVLKTKEEWNKETKNGTAIWYFYTRYKINNQIKQYKSGVFALKRNAEEEERLFKINPLEYIKTRSKKAKNTLKNNNTNSDAKTLNDYFEEFCNYKSHFVKDSVIYEYKIDWKNHIKEYFENKTLINIDYTLARQWYNDTINSSFSISSKNKWLSCLKEFFKYLKSNNLIEFNYFKDLEIFKNPKENKNTIKKIKYQTIEEYEFFMSEINEEDFWYAFFNFIFWHGCRIGE